MLNIVIGLFPALMWGILPILLTKIGGQPIHQMVGTTLGALAVAIVIFCFTYSQVHFTWLVVLLCFVSGLFWSIGQINQYRAFNMIGVSQTMPLSTGLNLISNSLFGVIVFGEWATTTKLILGFSAICVIIIGVSFTSYQQERSNKEAKKFKKGIWILLLSTIGYVGYATLPNFTHANGWTTFLPQVSGMVVGTFIHALFEPKERNILQRESWLNLVSGMVFSLGALGYLISLQSNGVAIGYTLSQMGVVLSTIGGILFLHEKKNHKETLFMIMGLVLICIGGVLIGLTK
ncbi:GRP family sugar transporter [Utexia brackfieldae]|uniref:GRP family sugar transporter n=1 Tax=Utexia brackfieldae TaxID=3074108 RepID=UPI00370D90D4